MNHSSEEDLILHYYGERDDSAHLSTCAACRRNLEALRAVLDSCGDYATPERPADYEQQVWNGLRQSALSVKRRAFSWRLPALAAAVAAMIVLAFLAGKFSQQQKRPAAVFSTLASHNILQAALTDYVERSELLLIEISHLEQANISEQRQRARDLLGESRLYRQTAVFASDGPAAAVLDDLERVLLALAHMPPAISTPELRKIQKRIEEQGLIFKLRVLDLNLRPTQKL